MEHEIYALATQPIIIQYMIYIIYVYNIIYDIYVLSSKINHQFSKFFLKLLVEISNNDYFGSTFTINLP